MKKLNKLSIFFILSLVLCMMLSVVAYATDAIEGTVATEAETVETEGSPSKSENKKLDKNLGGSGKDDPALTFKERVEYAVQGTVTGMVMVFSVLTLLTLILYGSKIVFYDIPNKKNDKKKEIKKTKIVAVETEKVEIPSATAKVFSAESESPVSTQDDGELAAVITAAIAAMLESEEYKNEFVGGFRVVSFKRSSQGAWNRK